MQSIELPIVQLIKTLRIAMISKRYPQGYTEEAIIGIYSTLLAICAEAGVQETDLM